MAITEADIEARELEFLNKRLVWKIAENEYGRAYEALLAARRQFLSDKLSKV